mgnify:CR=1 FL=1
MNQPYVTLILIPEFWRHSLVISQHNAKTPEKKSVLLRPATRSGYSIFFVISIILMERKTIFQFFSNTLLTIVAK